MFQQTRDRAQGVVEYGLIIFGPAVSSLLGRLGGSV